MTSTTKLTSRDRRHQPTFVARVGVLRACAVRGDVTRIGDSRIDESHFSVVAAPSFVGSGERTP